jgi:hypothetical protein
MLTSPNSVFRVIRIFIYLLSVGVFFLSTGFIYTTGVFNQRIIDQVSIAIAMVIISGITYSTGILCISNLESTIETPMIYKIEFV